MIDKLHLKEDSEHSLTYEKKKGNQFELIVTQNTKCKLEKILMLNENNLYFRYET